jgi:hypothetical protein
MDMVWREESWIASKTAGFLSNLKVQIFPQADGSPTVRLDR